MPFKLNYKLKENQRHNPLVCRDFRKAGKGEREREAMMKNGKEQSG